MEENTVQGQTVQSTEVQTQLSNPWLKIALLAVLGLVLAGGLVFAGMQIGKSSKLKSQKSKIQLKTQNLTPTQPPVATSSPTFQPESTPLLDETAGWKSYTNEKYGYSMKYPPEFNYKVSVKGEIMVAFDPSWEILESPAAEDKTLVIIVADTSKPVIDKTYYGEPTQIAEETKVTIDGEIGQQVVFSQPVAWIQTVVSHGNRSFYFNLQNMQYRSEYDQILSTFRFLD